MLPPDDTTQPEVDTSAPTIPSPRDPLIPRMARADETVTTTRDSSLLCLCSIGTRPHPPHRQAWRSR